MWLIAFANYPTRSSAANSSSSCSFSYNIYCNSRIGETEMGHHSKSFFAHGFHIRIRWRQVGNQNACQCIWRDPTNAPNGRGFAETVLTIFDWEQNWVCVCWFLVSREILNDLCSRRSNGKITYAVHSTGRPSRRPSWTKTRDPKL